MRFGLGFLILIFSFSFGGRVAAESEGSEDLASSAWGRDERTFYDEVDKNKVAQFVCDLLRDCDSSPDQPSSGQAAQTSSSSSK